MVRRRSRMSVNCLVFSPKALTLLSTEWSDISFPFAPVGPVAPFLPTTPLTPLTPSTPFGPATGVGRVAGFMEETTSRDVLTISFNSLISLRTSVLSQGLVGSGTPTGPAVGGTITESPFGPVAPVGPVGPVGPAVPAFEFAIAATAPPFESYLPADSVKHLSLSAGFRTPSSNSSVSISAIIRFSPVLKAGLVPTLASAFRIRARLRQRILRTKSGRGGIRLPTIQFKKSRISFGFIPRRSLNTTVLFFRTSMPNSISAVSSFGM